MAKGYVISATLVLGQRATADHIVKREEGWRRSAKDSCHSQMMAKIPLN
jgi:hypothetical protein